MTKLTTVAEIRDEIEAQIEGFRHSYSSDKALNNMLGYGRQTLERLLTLIDKGE